MVSSGQQVFKSREAQAQELTLLWTPVVGSLFFPPLTHLHARLATANVAHVRNRCLCSVMISLLMKIVDPSVLQNLTDLNVPFSESFGSGTITGDLFTDTVSIGGVNLGEFKFELATDGTGTALSAGTVGLGFVNNFTPELVSRGIIDTQSFSLLLSESGGEMLLGGINPGNFG